MKITVEQCFAHNLYFRINLPGGGRETVWGDKWGRKQARLALDMLENVYGYNRKSIRFIHR